MMILCISPFKWTLKTSSSPFFADDHSCTRNYRAPVAKNLYSNPGQRHVSLMDLGDENLCISAVHVNEELGSPNEPSHIFKLLQSANVFVSIDMPFLVIGAPLPRKDYCMSCEDNRPIFLFGKEKYGLTRANVDFALAGNRFHMSETIWGAPDLPLISISRELSFTWPKKKTCTIFSGNNRNQEALGGTVGLGLQR